MLQIKDIVLRAGDPPLNHTFEDAAISVVLGANRSGKTLLCRVLAGLAAPVSGSLMIDGGVVEPGAPRAVALVMQSFVNYPAWTVADNIASPLTARGVARSERRRRATEIASRLGLEGLLDRYPHELSGGQQQRVAIGRALAQGARVLVLDEPLVNLDYKLREALRDELRALLTVEGLCVIYTTTDPVDAFVMAHQVVLMEDHGFVQSGTPLDVYQYPTSFSAAALMSEPTVNVLSEGHAVAAVRPEHVRLAEPGADAARKLSLLVEEVETNGAHTFIHGLVGRDGWIIKANGMVHAEIDRPLAIWVREADVLRFEAH